MNKILLLIRKENSEYANNKYIESIERFGSRAILVYDYYSEDECLKVLKDVAGILLPGGDCVGRLDFFLIKYALDNNLRLLGICQGMQSMALFASDDSLVEIGNLQHKAEEGYAHSVILSSSKLKDIYGREQIMVNSHHKQTVLKSYSFLVVGRSNDGLIEAIESSSDVFQIGVQWHPERMIEYDEDSLKLLKKFVLGR